MAITWLGEASDDFANPAGRGFICRIAQDPRHRSRLLEKEVPVLRFEYHCRTRHLDSPNIASNQSCQPALGKQEEPRRKRNRRSTSGQRQSDAEGSSFERHSSSDDDSGRHLSTQKHRHYTNHQRWQNDIDTALANGEIEPNDLGRRATTYTRRPTKGGATQSEAKDGAESGDFSEGGKEGGARRGDLDEKPQEGGGNKKLICGLKLVVSKVISPVQASKLTLLFSFTLHRLK